MVLWKKESSGAGVTLYTDLFADKTKITGYKQWNRRIEEGDWRPPPLNLFEVPGKNNMKSEGYRTQGNMRFAGRRWTEAMELYSQSLCFAEPDMPNVGLVYFSRASCFFELKMYDESLRDIELAEKANYPNKEKLLVRKVRFQEAVKTAEKTPKLSFEPNKHFPCMANVLDVEQNAKFGRYIVAKCGIDVGQTVLVEDCSVSGTAACNDQMQCDTCLHKKKNFIACSKCTDVMFCDENCQRQNDIHREFCGENFFRMPNAVKYIAKSILIATIAYPDVDKLRRTVVKSLQNRQKQKPSAANDLQSKYKLFLMLQPDNSEKLDIELTYKVYTALIDISKVKKMFDSIQNKRFLMHLIGEHLLILSKNSYGGLNQGNSE